VFDLRYHVASLAAVFLALIVGILVGVAITRGGFVSKAERKVLNDQLAEAQGQRDAARQRSNDLEQEQKATSEYVTETYSALMSDRLRGKKIVLVSIGPMDGDRLDDVRGALADAGVASPLRIRAIKVPVDDKSVDEVLSAHRAFAEYVGSDRLPDLGRALAGELVLGGRTPLWTALSSQLVEERVGPERPPADGVVVMRSVEPQRDGTARFLGGFYSGLVSAGAPAVGVEARRTKPSAVSAFEQAGLSTVDSIDKLSGRLALVLLLGGAQPGQYGLRPTATDGVLPPVQPLAPAVG
jgi:Copper transport outer membrane protein, MctB